MTRALHREGEVDRKAETIWQLGRIRMTSRPNLYALWQNQGETIRAETASGQTSCWFSWPPHCALGSRAVSTCSSTQSRMKTSALSLIIVVVLTLPVLTPAAQHRKNVLFLMVDDLRPQLNCYKDNTTEGPPMHTPNIDLLAARSLLLKNAHVQQALCSPSRTSMLTGRRPDTTHVHDHDRFTYWRKVAGNFTTIPQYFKENGYYTVGMGKIFHRGKSGIADDPVSWSGRYYHAPNKKYYFGRKKKSWKAVTRADIRTRPLPDQQLARHAKHVLKRLAPKARSGERPFFMAVGFMKPHLPFVFPAKYLSLYPMEDIALPSNPRPPLGMPSLAWFKWGEMRGYKDIEELHLDGTVNSTMPDQKAKELRRAYYASVTYIDSLVGALLKELSILGLEEKTIVVLLGDHGWQLGEHGLWGKQTNFELSTRTPMIISIPGKTDHGKISKELVEFVDLFPTLVEAAGLPKISQCPRNSQEIELCTEGVSMMPLVNNKRRVSWKNRVFSQYPRRNRVMGYSMRTKRYRYTEWVYYHGKPLYMPDWSRTFAEELYDHKKDPYENNNVVFKGAYKYMRRKLRRFLHLGWRAALP